MRFRVVIDAPDQRLLQFDTGDLNSQMVTTLVRGLVRCYGGEPGIRIALTRLHKVD